tara:strand:- start:4019 stop:4183 length:165 start_codon:yes stop_codon:yes gene_type:complete
MSNCFLVISVMLLIMAGGSIDGPTGYELNNWLGCALFAAFGLLFGFVGLYLQDE